MRRVPKRDHSTFKEKVALRRALLEELKKPPTILDAYGGRGLLYRACYDGLVSSGCVIDKDARKVELLARQRPDWVVVQGNSEALIDAGLMADVQFDVLDADAWGSPLRVVRGFLNGERRYADIFWVVATDGIRLKLRAGGKINLLEDMILDHSWEYVRKHYDSVLYESLQRDAAAIGFTPTFWRFYYTGHAKNMAHWAVCFERQKP